MLIQIDKEFVLWREWDNQSSNNNTNFNQTAFFANQGSRFQRKYPTKAGARRQQKVDGNPSIYKANSLELALIQKDTNFSHSFKLLNVARTMNNSLLKMIVDEVGNEKQIFEEFIMHQDDRYDFKGLSPLMFCITSNLVDTVYYLLSICEKFGLTDKACSLTLEKVSTDGGQTCKFLEYF